MNLIDVVIIFHYDLQKKKLIIFHYELDGFIKKKGFSYVHVDVIIGTAWNNAKQ